MEIERKSTNGFARLAAHSGIKYTKSTLLSAGSSSSVSCWCPGHAFCLRNCDRYVSNQNKRNKNGGNWEFEKFRFTSPRNIYGFLIIFQRTSLDAMGLKKFRKFVPLVIRLVRQREFKKNNANNRLINHDLEIFSQLLFIIINNLQQTTHYIALIRVIVILITIRVGNASIKITVFFDEFDVLSTFFFLPFDSLAGMHSQTFTRDWKSTHNGQYIYIYLYRYFIPNGELSYNEMYLIINQCWNYEETWNSLQICTRMNFIFSVASFLTVHCIFNYFIKYLENCG